MDQHAKHSPRVEDALRDPRTSTPAGYRDDTRPHEDEEDVLERSGLRPDVATPPGAPDPVEAARISELGRFLSPRAFPGFRDQLLASALDNDAPAWIRDELARVPGDRLFDDVSDLWAAMRGLARS